MADDFHRPHVHRLMPDFDNAWKEALEALFEPFMAFFFSDAHGDIDWSRRHEMLDKELQQITPESEQGRRVVDKLVKVWRKNGEDEWVLIHIEVQSQPDSNFAKRMYVYNYRLFDRYNRKVASFAILGDDRSGWRPHQFGYELWGTKAGIEFATAKLLDYAADEPALEANPNPFAVVVLAHLKTNTPGTMRQGAPPKCDWSRGSLSVASVPGRYVSCTV